MDARKILIKEFQENFPYFNTCFKLICKQKLCLTLKK